MYLFSCLHNFLWFPTEYQFSRLNLLYFSFPISNNKYQVKKNKWAKKLWNWQEIALWKSIWELIWYKSNFQFVNNWVLKWNCNWHFKTGSENLLYCVRKIWSKWPKTFPDDQKVSYLSRKKIQNSHENTFNKLAAKITQIWANIYSSKITKKNAAN